MTNLGKVEIGDSIRLETILTNISSGYSNADDIKISVVNSDDSLLINTTSTNISNFSTGMYRYDLYLDNNTFSSGSHYIIWTGYSQYGTVNFSFYQEDYLYIDKNRLI